ncbi:MAG: transposase [Desulfobacterales bacterium]|nr:transposase [Desulfobacterales bacterium]
MTHRCHKKDFLLKFSKDRQRWLQWLFEARKRYETSILNYIVTSNHVHLLVYDTGEPESIPRMLQLVAGRTAQEYNQRKMRKGAFWEDRYHATAVETDDHLIRCMVYIDINMVRAGVVTHPSEWKESGYNEIQNPRKRYAIIDQNRLLSLFGKATIDDLKSSHFKWVEQGLEENKKTRQSKWTESIAIGSDEFVAKTKKQVGTGKIESKDEDFYLRESQEPFGLSEASDLQNEEQNSYEWSVFA